MTSLGLADATGPPLLLLAGTAMVVIGGAPNAWAIPHLRRQRSTHQTLFAATFMIGLASLIAAAVWLVATVASAIDNATT